MKIRIGDGLYDFDGDKLSVREAFVIYDQTKMTIQTWQEQLVEGNPYAIAALAFLLKRRAGEDVDWETLDFDLGSFVAEGVDDEDGDASDSSPESSPSDGG